VAGYKVFVVFEWENIIVRPIVEECPCAFFFSHFKFVRKFRSWCHFEGIDLEHRLYACCMLEVVDGGEHLLDSGELI